MHLTTNLFRKAFILGRYLIATLFILLGCFSKETYALELRLHDCDGNLRASTEIEEGQTKGIKLSLSNEESNSKAKLSKADSESVLELRAKETSLIFSSVEGGDWKVCKENGSTLVFNSVEFIESGSNSLKVASLIAGGAAVLSGAAIAAGNPESDSSVGATNIIEPSQPDRAVSTKPTSALSPGSSGRPDGQVLVPSRCGKTKISTLAARSNDCREGEEAPIISPYD